MLAGIFCSFLLPTIFFENEIEVFSNLEVENLIIENQLNETIITEKTEYTKWIFLGISIISVALVSLLFGKVLLLLQKIKKLRKKEEFGISYVESKNENEAFSFYKYIVVSSKNVEKEALKKILIHENIHVKELHTLDILFIKSVEALFWFNPILRFYKKAMEENHEFLADQKTVEKNAFSSYDYQKLIVQLQIKNTTMMGNSFKKQSTLKRRIVMLQKEKSASRNLLKILVILPFLASFMMVAQVEKKEIIKEVKEEKPEVIEKEILILKKEKADKEAKRLKQIKKEKKAKEKKKAKVSKKKKKIAKKKALKEAKKEKIAMKKELLEEKRRVLEEKRAVIAEEKRKMMDEKARIKDEEKKKKLMSSYEKRYKEEAKKEALKRLIWKDENGNVISRYEFKKRLLSEGIYEVKSDGETYSLALKS
ncbi:M56 family metallopeptidase [Aureivirga marina]|uniref:M56 family metallopeptidase n=1 Tax=Aureivirga marina TaxID=1182451 RepID=UPI0018CA6D84|nr:M56 family metallopeptidase [Aureivirga marina]